MNSNSGRAFTTGQNFEFGNQVSGGFQNRSQSIRKPFAKHSETLRKRFGSGRKTNGRRTVPEPSPKSVPFARNPRPKARGSCVSQSIKFAAYSDNRMQLAEPLGNPHPSAPSNRGNYRAFDSSNPVWISAGSHTPASPAHRRRELASQQDHPHSRIAPSPQMVGSQASDCGFAP